MSAKNDVGMFLKPTRLVKDDLASYIKSLGHPPVGLFTGFKKFDDRHGRIFEPRHLILVAARPGGAKTIFGVQQAEYHAAQKLNTLVWSLEMSREQLIQRLISKHAGISVKDLKNRNITPEGFAKINEAAEYIYGLPIYVNDLSAATDAYIRDETTALHNKLIKETGKGLALIVVDYIQLAAAEEDQKNREREVASVANVLRILAKELNVPILALAQLSRDLEKRVDKRPIMSDLAESGALERHAHTIMFLHRESMYCDACKAGQCVIRR